MGVAIPAVPINYNQGSDTYAYVNNETRLYVAAMTVKPTSARKGIIDTLVTAIKGVGFSKFDGFHLLKSHDAQASRINLITPGTYTAAILGTPLFIVDTGWERASGANDGILVPGHIADAPGSKWTLNSAHLGAWTLTEPNANNNGIIGYTTAGFMSVDNASANLTARLNDTTNLSVANSGGTGYFVANRSASNARQAYKNGASITSDAAVSVATPTTGQPMAYLQRNGSSVGAAIATRMAIGHWGSSLSAGDVAALNTALATFIAAF